MGSYKSLTYDVDLGVTHRRGGCAQHKRSGFNAECEACQDAPFEAVPVPELAGFFVEIRNPRVLPYGQRKELYREADEDTPAARQARLERIVKGLIIRWNLVAVDDPSDNPPILPIPTDDNDSLDRAPDVINPILAEIGWRAEEPAVPKETATA